MDAAGVYSLMATVVMLLMAAGLVYQRTIIAGIEDESVRERERKKEYGEKIALLECELDQARDESSCIQQDYNTVLQDYQVLEKSSQNKDGELARLKNLLQDKEKAQNELSQAACEFSRKICDIFEN